VQLSPIGYIKSPIKQPNLTFAIRGEKRLFLGMNRLETLDFKGMDFQKGL